MPFCVGWGSSSKLTRAAGAGCWCAFEPKAVWELAHKRLGEKFSRRRVSLFGYAKNNSRTNPFAIIPSAPFLLWRRERDSNPRVLSHKLISSQPRYDHFDTSPYMLNSVLEYNDYSILCHFCSTGYIITQHFQKSKPFLKRICKNRAKMFCIWS